MAIQHCVRACKEGLRPSSCVFVCVCVVGLLCVCVLTFKFPLTFTLATAAQPFFLGVFTKVKVMVIGWRGECLT